MSDATDEPAELTDWAAAQKPFEVLSTGYATLDMLLKDMTPELLLSRVDGMLRGGSAVPDGVVNAVFAAMVLAPSDEAVRPELGEFRDRWRRGGA
jgi:hypothetical protein